MFYGQEIDMIEALIITAFSMGLVFVTLIAISLILRGFKLVFYKDNKKKTETIKAVSPEPKSVEPSKTMDENKDEELVAAITAALAASLSQPSHNLIIKSIRRVPQDSPAWARAGRQEQVYNKL